MARRFGSAMISNADSMVFVYSMEYMLVKAYTQGQTTVVFDRLEYRSCRLPHYQ
jgi:hypothetical protein